MNKDDNGDMWFGIFFVTTILLLLGIGIYYHLCINAPTPKAEDIISTVVTIKNYTETKVTITQITKFQYQDRKSWRGSWTYYYNITAKVLSSVTNKEFEMDALVAITYTKINGQWYPTNTDIVK